MKILILNDGSGYSNWGIKACIDGLKKLFNDVDVDTISHEILHKKFNLKTTIFNKKFLSDENIFLNKFFSPFIRRPYLADDFDDLCFKWQKGQGGSGANYILEKVKNADIVLFNSEGSAYRNNIGAITGLFILYYSKVILNKSSYFINGSITISSEDPRMPSMIKITHDVIDGFFIRELESYENLKKFIPNSKKIYFSPDSVFNITNEYDGSRISDVYIKSLGKYICVSKSMIASNKKYFSKLLIELTKLFDHIILLAKDSEDQFLENIVDSEKIIFLGKEFDYFDVQFILKNSCGLISGRYHHLIFALKQGIPVIMLNTSSHKIVGLNKMYKGFVPRVFDPGNLKHEISEILEESSKLMNYNKIEIENISKKFNQDFKQMKNIICDK